MLLDKEEYMREREGEGAGEKIWAHFSDPERKERERRAREQ